MKEKVLSKHYNQGGKEIQHLKVGDTYQGYTVVMREATRTRKSMWITIKLQKDA